MEITAILAALSNALRLADALADAAATLNNGQPLSPEQIDRIQGDKIESERAWSEALARLRAKA